MKVGGRNGIRGRDGGSWTFERWRSMENQRCHHEAGTAEQTHTWRRRMIRICRVLCSGVLAAVRTPHGVHGSLPCIGEQQDQRNDPSHHAHYALKWGDRRCCILIGGCRNPRRPTPAVLSKNRRSSMQWPRVTTAGGGQIENRGLQGSVSCAIDGCLLNEQSRTALCSTCRSTHSLHFDLDGRM